jgi:DNA-binding LacI/PurR family transcriptional regulator
MTQAQIAEIAGVSARTVSVAINGMHSPRVDTVDKVEEAISGIEKERGIT